MAKQNQNSVSPHFISHGSKGDIGNVLMLTLASLTAGHLIGLDEKPLTDDSGNPIACPQLEILNPTSAKIENDVDGNLTQNGRQVYWMQLNFDSPFTDKKSRQNYPAPTGGVYEVGLFVGNNQQDRQVISAVTQILLNRLLKIQREWAANRIVWIRRQKDVTPTSSGGNGGRFASLHAMAVSGFRGQREKAKNVKRSVPVNAIKV